MKNIRILLIGFVIGGGAGAKIGAYLSIAFKETISWSLIEVGAGVGMGLGCMVSFIIILAKAGVFSPKESESESAPQRIATSRA